jgi:excisionase family DNA binding protein
VTTSLNNPPSLLGEAILNAIRDAVKEAIREAGGNNGQSLEKLLSAKQVAELLGEDERWVYQQARAKKIPSVKLGKYWKFSPSKLQTWLERKHTP